MVLIKAISISIVTYNSKDIFVTLDNIIEKLIPTVPLNIYIFDNNSSVEYKNKLKEYEKYVNIYFHDDNKGFGFGHNYNLALSEDDYFLVYNPDIVVTSENLKKMYHFMEQHQDVTLSVPKVLNEDGSTQYLIRKRLAVFDYILRFIPFKFVKKMFNKRLTKFECRDLSEEPQEISFGSGCFMFARRKDLIEIHGFDERFFMYFEDNDICQKIRQSNKKIYYLPNAEVTHFYAKGAHRNRKLFKIFLQSMYQYFNKWGWKFF